MQWRLCVRRIWKKQSQESIPEDTVRALRYLYNSYKKQRRLWAYIVFFSLMLISLFILFQTFLGGDTWEVVIPLLGIVFSMFQLYRCKDLNQIIRQALIVQQQIDRVRVEIERKKKMRLQGEIENLEARDNSSIDGDTPF